MSKAKILPKLLFSPHRVYCSHGTIEVKGNHNHHNRLYKICITKTGKIVECNRQHLKPTLISAEHCLHDQLHKHIKTDPLETFLHKLRNNHLHTTSAATQTMVKTVVTPHRVLQQCMENRTITRKEGKKIVNKNHCKQTTR